MWIVAADSSSKRCAARPWRRSLGEPSGCENTSISRQPMPRARSFPESALYAASFAASRAATCCAGNAFAVRIGQLVFGEQPLEHLLPTLGEHSLDARDVDRVDADARGSRSHRTGVERDVERQPDAVRDLERRREAGPPKHATVADRRPTPRAAVAASPSA